MLQVTLQESPDFLLYEQENTSVNVQEGSTKDLVKQWEVYDTKRALKLARSREVSSQTLPKYSIHKTTQKAPVEYQDRGSWATQWDMHDEYKRLAESEKKVVQIQDFLPRKKAEVIELYYGDLTTEEIHKDIFGAVIKGVSVTRLLVGLGWIERLLSTTLFLREIQIFTTGREHVQDQKKMSMAKKKAGMEELWKFSSSPSEGLRVNSLAFCQNSPWIILAGYGPLRFYGEIKGAFGGWNVKRIGHPEVWFEFPGTVSVVQTCPSVPQLCAVAFLDGTLMVYQLDSPTCKVIMDTSGSVDKHSAPIWSVDWKDSQFIQKVLKKDPLAAPSLRSLVRSLKITPEANVDVAHVLVSISEDGTVKEWVFTKEAGLVACTTLLRIRLPSCLALEIGGGLDTIMDSNELTPRLQANGKLKRVGTGESTPRKETARATTASESSRQGDRKGRQFGRFVIPQRAPGTGLSFRPGDPTTYIIGTVSGHVLLCRSFERDRCSQVYRKHTALVTSLSWRKSGDEASSVFLSAALDETICVWHVDKPQTPLCVLKVPKAVIGGYISACWCPWYGNLIAATHGAGLEVWDISLSSHTPILAYNMVGATCVAFSPHSKNVLAGDENGHIHVIHLEGLEESSSTFQRYSVALSKLTKLGMQPTV